MSHEVEVMQVIRTRLERRGLGKHSGDPIRGVEQYWTMDGKLIFEIDHWQESQRKGEGNK